MTGLAWMRIVGVVVILVGFWGIMGHSLVSYILHLRCYGR